jgi:hypothetical protein
MRHFGANGVSKYLKTIAGIRVFLQLALAVISFSIYDSMLNTSSTIAWHIS